MARQGRFFTYVNDHAHTTAFLYVMKLTGNKILLTGATSGVGLALLKHLHADNRVIAIGRNSERIAELQRQYPDVTFLRCDLADPLELRSLMENLRQNHSDCNWLINNAAVQFNYTLGTEPDAGRWITDEIHTNLIAPAQLCEALLPNLKQHPDALIVNVTSGLALSPKRSAPVYCATKAGLRIFTKALRYQLEDSRVRVVELMLPLVDTPMTEGRGGGKISAAKVAEALTEGLRRSDPVIFVGKAALFRRIHRWLPALADRILRNG